MLLDCWRQSQSRPPREAEAAWQAELARSLAELDSGNDGIAGAAHAVSGAQHLEDEIGFTCVELGTLPAACCVRGFFMTALGIEPM